MAVIKGRAASGSGTTDIQLPNANGRAAAAASRPVAISTEDLAALNALASQTTLAAILAKIVASPALDATIVSSNTKLDTLHADLVTLEGYVDGLETLVTATNTKSDTLHADLASILAKLLPTSSTTGTQSSVAGSASAVTLLVANAARVGATFFNDSTAICYLILSSTTPTTSAYTVQLGPYDYYEVPARYTGIVKGIWASATGNMRVTELA